MLVLRACVILVVVGCLVQAAILQATMEKCRIADTWLMGTNTLPYQIHKGTEAECIAACEHFPGGCVGAYWYKRDGRCYGRTMIDGQKPSAENNPTNSFLMSCVWKVNKEMQEKCRIADTWLMGTNTRPYTIHQGTEAECIAACQKKPGCVGAYWYKTDGRCLGRTMINGQKPSAENVPQNSFLMSCINGQ